MKIGEKTLKELADLAEGAMLTHIGGINAGFRNAGEKDFKIGLKGTINAGAGDGDFKLKIDIDYVIEKTSDSFSRQVHEKQASLDLDGPTKPCPLLPVGDEVYVSVCSKCKERQSTIVSDGVNLPVFYGHREPMPEVPEGALVSFMPCKSWSDEDYRIFCDDMLRRAVVYETEQKAKADEKQKQESYNWYRIRNKQTNNWWENTAMSAVDACKKAGWNPEDCEIKIKSDNGGGGWKKCRELEMKKAA